MKEWRSDMSLPLPVFRLDAHTELPFEPVCALAPRAASFREARGEARAAGMLTRVLQWIVPSRSAGAAGAANAGAD